MTPSAVVQLRSMRTAHRQKPARTSSSTTTASSAYATTPSTATRATSATVSAHELLQRPPSREAASCSELLRQLSMPNPATRRAGGRID